MATTKHCKPLKHCIANREQTLDTVEEVSENAYLLEHERWNFNAFPLNFNAFPLSRMETPIPPFFSIKCLDNYSVSMMYQMSACISYVCKSTFEGKRL